MKMKYLRILCLITYTIGQLVLARASRSQDIARKKCQEWKNLTDDVGSPCTVNIPLAWGGSTADVGEFPHMVSLLSSYPSGPLTHMCGGILIDKNYVLTVAHCVQATGGKTEVFARIGYHDLGVAELGVVFDVEVVEKIVHPDFRPPRKYHNIALLKLSYEVPFNKRIRPACLPFRDTRIEAGTRLVVAGWGAYDNTRRTSHVLRKAEVIAMDRLTCDSNPFITSSVSSFAYPAGMTNSLLCMDASQGGSCGGDSGGPLMVAGASMCDVKEVVGLVSGGAPECSATTIPGIYTNVEYYLDWIVRNVWPDEQ